MTSPVLHSLSPSKIQSAANKNVQLKFQCKCKPEPVISWSKNGAKIQPSNKFETVTTNNEFVLIIHQVCFFKNALKIVLNLFIFNKFLDFRSKNKTKAFMGWLLWIVQDRILLLFNWKLIMTSPWIQGFIWNLKSIIIFVFSLTPPKITRHPLNQQCSAGQDVTFDCEFDAEQLTSIQWFHNDKLLQPNRDVAIERPNPSTSCLQLTNVQKENEGDYLFVVRNKSGEDLTSTTLKLVEGN